MKNIWMNIVYVDNARTFFILSVEQENLSEVFASVSEYISMCSIELRFDLGVKTKTD